MRSNKTAEEHRYLRFTVNSGGCSGFQYEFKLDTDDSITEHDIQVEQDGERLIIDSMSLTFVSDGEIDYTTEMIRSSFAMTKNTIADHACGCGASFSVSPQF